jgi:hypothetical protein
MPRRGLAPFRLTLVAALAIQLWAIDVLAQPAVRRATNLASLVNYPAFYQLRPIILIGALKTLDTGRLQVSDESLTMPVSFKGSAPDGLSEVRGELWDLGRLNPDDPRLSGIDVRSVFGIDPEGAWPLAGQAMAIVASAVEPAAQPNLPTVRNMVLFPARYREQRVTVVGQFAGRNLLGDLPDAPARSRFDFVLKTADAAIWVTGLRPRGKDFELALDARIDTGRWLEVTGTLQQGRGLQWLDGEEGGTLTLAKAPIGQVEAAPVRVAAAPPPEVIFSAPTEGETDVALAASVRIQFSRDVSAATLKNRIRIEYAGIDGAVPIADFTTDYRAAPRVLEIKFAKPLDPFRRVRVAFTDGVLGMDEQPLVPWSLTFETGG